MKRPSPRSCDAKAQSLLFSFLSWRLCDFARASLRDKTHRITASSGGGPASSRGSRIIADSEQTRGKIPRLNPTQVFLLFDPALYTWGVAMVGKLPLSRPEIQARPPRPPAPPARLTSVVHAGRSFSPASLPSRTPRAPTP